MELYNVVFQCTYAGYYWISEKGLTLEEAERLTINKNKYDKIHGSCCQYFIQPIEK